MVNKTKILSDLSKMAVDAMSTFSGIKKEVETIVRLRVDKVINKMRLVKRDEFEVLKKIDFPSSNLLNKRLVSDENKRNKVVWIFLED